MEVKLLDWSNVRELYENKNMKSLLSYNFYISGITRLNLQEIARHRSLSLSVKSSRYTLSKDLKNENAFTDLEKDKERASKYIKFTENDLVNLYSLKALENLRLLVNEKIANDILKYAMPECYLVDLAMTINFDGLKNFLTLRTSSHALAEIRELAFKMFEVLPENQKLLFEQYLSKQ